MIRVPQQRATAARDKAPLKKKTLKARGDTVFSFQMAGHCATAKLIDDG